MGRGEKLALKTTIELADYKEGVCDAYVKALAKEIEAAQKDAPVDMSNTLQDLLAAVNKTAYLLTLK